MYLFIQFTWSIHKITLKPNCINGATVVAHETDGNIIVLFDEIRLGDRCKDLKIEDFKYECSALN